jgi:threonine/homoserine/homoserine lactone efflux protein
MIYLISRSLSQGSTAGLISLGGVTLGYVFYMLCAAFGITALLLAIPYAYDALRFGGVVYLLYLAWQTVKPGEKTLFQDGNLQKHSLSKLFMMGLVTNLLNPAIAALYLSLLPLFITPERGNLLGQSLVLGFTQIAIAVTANALIALMAGFLASFLASQPTWLAVQRWIMGTMLAGLAVRMAIQARR